MSYGSASMRTFYGAGDYNRALALAGGYYRAGGFGSFLKKAVGAVSGLASNPLVSAATSFLPGGGLISKGLQLAGKYGGMLAGSAATTAGKALGQAAATGIRSTVSGALASKAAGMAPGMMQAAVAGAARRAAPRRRRRSSGRSLAAKTIIVKEAPSSRRRGDVIVQRARPKGRRVSFMSGGRRVSFTARKA